MAVPRWWDGPQRPAPACGSWGWGWQADSGPSDELQCEVMELLLAGQCARLITGASSPSLPVSHTGPQDESSTLKSSLVTVTEWSDSSDV